MKYHLEPLMNSSRSNNKTEYENCIIICSPRIQIQDTGLLVCSQTELVINVSISFLYK